MTEASKIVIPIRKCNHKGCFQKPEKNGYCKEHNDQPNT